MHVEPMTCYRPRPERARDFVSPPYDVFTRAEAAAYVSVHPQSILAIERPETAFSPNHDMYANDVYDKAKERLVERLTDGTLQRDPTPCFYLYRLRRAEHEQTGIVAAFSVDDYNNGVIRRHELTRPEKEADRIRHIEATGCQTGPVMLCYRDNPVLEALVEAAKAAEPVYDFRDAQGVRETVWRIARPAAVESLRMMLDHVGRAYICDGHHRAAAAARVCQRMRTGEKDRCTGEESYNFMLCALFPASHLAVLPYHRVVADAAGLTEDELVAAIEARGLVVGPRAEEPVTPAGRGRFGMWAFGAWRELSLAGPAPEGLVESLDVSVLQDRVLGPVLGVTDPREDPRVSYVGGVGAGELASRAGEKGVAFSLFPTSVSDLMAVADAGLMMPPKSTWFDPKLSCGLFVRRTSNCETLGGRRRRRAEEQ